VAFSTIEVFFMVICNDFSLGDRPHCVRVCASGAFIDHVLALTPPESKQSISPEHCSELIRFPK
jgi:hypothetical protein